MAVDAPGLRVFGHRNGAALTHPNIPEHDWSAGEPETYTFMDDTSRDKEDATWVRELPGVDFIEAMGTGKLTPNNVWQAVRHARSPTSASRLRTRRSSMSWAGLQD